MEVIKLDRVKEVFKWGVIINFSTLVLVAVVITIVPKEIITVFARDAGVLDIGSSYLRVNAIGYCIFSISYVTNGIITGSGKTMVTMIISAISLLLIRIPLANFMSETNLGIMGIWYAILITYVFTTICSLVYYSLGKYKVKLNIAVCKLRIEDLI